MLFNSSISIKLFINKRCTNGDDGHWDVVRVSLLPGPHLFPSASKSPPLQRAAFVARPRNLREMPPPSVAGSSPGSRRSSISSIDGGVPLSDDEAVGGRASWAPPPRPPPLAATSPAGPSGVSFAGAAAAEQPFKAFVRTASGQFSSALEWMGVHRQPRSVLLHENVERSHFEPTR